MGPPGADLEVLRQFQGRELRSRAAETTELQDELGPASISALQKSYSLSVSFAQVCAQGLLPHVQHRRGLLVPVHNISSYRRRR